MAGHLAETEPNPANARDQNRGAILLKGLLRAIAVAWFFPLVSFLPLTVLTPPLTTSVVLLAAPPSLHSLPSSLHPHRWETTSEPPPLLIAQRDYAQRHGGGICISTGNNSLLHYIDVNKEAKGRFYASLGLCTMTTFRLKGEKLSASFNIVPLVPAFEEEAIVTRSGWRKGGAAARPCNFEQVVRSRRL